MHWFLQNYSVWITSTDNVDRKKLAVTTPIYQLQWNLFKIHFRIFSNVSTITIETVRIIYGRRPAECIIDIDYCMTPNDLCRVAFRIFIVKERVTAAKE